MTIDGTDPITNNEDVIDSRDVIARIAFLESCQDDETEGLELDEDEVAELKALRELAGEAEDYAADWHYGESLIRDSYFENYARELADDCGMIQKGAGWPNNPNNHIDWEAAADELKHGDYTSVDFDGVTYWVR